MKPQLIFTVILLVLICQPSFSQSTSKIYFTKYDQYFGRVYSDNLGGGNTSILVNNVDRPYGIAIDWSVTPHKMYVGMGGANKITRYDIDGTNPVDIINDAASIGVTDIELDLHNRRIYWLKNTYSDDRIYWASMDGYNTNITQIYATTTTARDLWGLALDVANDRLWITERGSSCTNSRLRRMTMGGSSQTTLISPICNPHDIEFYNGNIYFGTDDGLIKAEPDGSGQIILSSSANLMYLDIDATHTRAFWTENSTVKRIELDGTGETTIVSGISPLAGIATNFNPAAMPVELIFFNARIINNSVSLQWETATEVNNYGFEVQRAVGSKEYGVWSNWENIGFVQGHGNSNSPKVYSFTDNLNLNSNRNLKYRLKQIDTDGKFEYSDIVEVEINQIPTEFALYQNYPNPFNPSTVIKYGAGSKEHVVLKVFDILGNEVASIVNEPKEPGFYEVEFNASNLSSGVYFYGLNVGKFSSRKKMLLIK